MKLFSSPLVVLGAVAFMASCSVPSSHSVRAIPTLDAETSIAVAVAPSSANLSTGNTETTNVSNPFAAAATPEASPQGGSATRSDGSVVQPWEFVLSGSGINNKNFDAGNGSLSASVGYFFSTMIEGSVRQLIAFADPGKGQSSAINGATRVAVDAHFGTEKVVPYLGANFGWVYGDTVKETMVAGPEGGLKIFVKDDVFFNIAMEYLFFFQDSNNAGDAFKDGQFIYTLGFGLRF